MSSIKNVALVGASGSLGTVVFSKLVESGRFNITVVRRTGSTATFPAGTTVVDADYASEDSLKKALTGQDAVVCTVASAAGDVQFKLIDAAVAAGIKRFIPAEFGSDTTNAKTRVLPMVSNKVKIIDYLKEKCEESSMTYTIVNCNAFLDWGLQYNFIFDSSEAKPEILDGGDLPFSTTTLATNGDAVVAIFKHLDETKNRHIFIHDTIITQNRLLELAKQVAPNKPWAPVQVKLADRVAAGAQRLQQGIFDVETIKPFLMQAVLQPGYGGKFEKTDNELLGLPGKTDADIIEIVKPLLA